MSSSDHLPLPSGAVGLIEYQSIFFAILGDRVVYSDIGEPNVFPPNNDIDFRRSVTGLLPISEGVLVFTEAETYILTVGVNLELTPPIEITRPLITDTQGCINRRSCRNLKNVPLWISNDGICTFENGFVQVISRTLLGKHRYDIKDSAVYDQQYILLLQDNSFLIFDYRTNNINFHKVSNTGFTVESLHADSGNLYMVGRSSGSDNLVYTVFGGSDNMSMNYESVSITEGSNSVVKYYDKIYIKYKGNISFSLYVNGGATPILSKSLESSDELYIKVCLL